MTGMTGPDCAVMCNLINTHTHTHTHTHARGYVQFNKYTHTHTHTHGAQGSSKICTIRESVSPLSSLIRGFRNKYH